ncbi:hypothetical protein BDQ94DRAFT_141128 [Aspergillus welwitschiae]|uniref:Uncharacterized protein n=1 Tax=Aspergillus welwitschiae TaxID=1341132 RepID=A0A3F3Q722_9EURO|nr:hypothetical protein BDQ94DRAFT_141128 [Aspergillus welwitschiae]RDH34915.1 hypothetical protein BDQ94DRAFT_141128 [Aspergillus welwitschiae]
MWSCHPLADLARPSSDGINPTKAGASTKKRQCLGSMGEARRCRHGRRLGGWRHERNDGRAHRCVGWSRIRAPDGKVVSLAQECGISNQRRQLCTRGHATHQIGCGMLERPLWPAL